MPLGSVLVGGQRSILRALPSIRLPFGLRVPGFPGLHDRLGGLVVVALPSRGVHGGRGRTSSQWRRLIQRAEWIDRISGRERVAHSLSRARRSTGRGLRLAATRAVESWRYRGLGVVTGFGSIKGEVERLLGRYAALAWRGRRCFRQCEVRTCPWWSVRVDELKKMYLITYV